ncbi:TRAP transporter substrate-binding protein DctP [Amphritea sp.]|uniref:TRAP transporter substrate-binding protein DctP n=1 Tax=Amphritea sp. TaxID=1872502 RepID=UPI003A8D14A7
MFNNKLSILKYLTLSTVFAFSCSQLAQAETLKLAIGTSPKDAPAGQALYEWSELIEKYSDGEIETIEYYQNELGGQQEVFDLLVSGEIDGMLTWPMTSYDKRIGVIYTPYMVTSWDEALKAYSDTGWLSATLNSVYKDIGLKFMGPWPEGFNGVATSKHYATDSAAAKDIKVRTIPAFPFPQTMQALGYQTASIDWGEVYTALQTGVVDGDAGNVIYWDYEYFRDTLDYYVRTKHMFMTAMFLMNDETFADLTETQQAAIRRASNEMVAKQFKEAKKVDNFYVAEAVKSGMKYIELNDEELKAHATLAREKVWPVMREELGAEIMDIVTENAEKL